MWGIKFYPLSTNDYPLDVRWSSRLLLAGWEPSPDIPQCQTRPGRPCKAPNYEQYQCGCPVLRRAQRGVGRETALFFDLHRQLTTDNCRVPRVRPFFGLTRDETLCRRAAEPRLGCPAGQKVYIVGRGHGFHIRPFGWGV